MPTELNLYRRHRPNSLKQVLGNTETRRVLMGFAKSDSPPRAYLLTGPSGCGKTTLARIFARMVGASEGDIFERDSASYRGIDSIRQLREQVSYRPSIGSKARVFILDECHRLTPDAQEALLKVLEDTPASTFIMLATTEPNKLKNTIRTRTTELPVTPLSDDDMHKLLRVVCKREQKVVVENAREKIVEKAGGSARMALVLLEKAMQLPKSKQEEVVKGYEDLETQAIELARLLINKKTQWRTVASLLKKLKQQNEEPESIRRLLLQYGETCLLNGDNPRAFLVMLAMRQDFYSTGFPGLVCACYDSLFAE